MSDEHQGRGSAWSRRALLQMTAPALGAVAAIVARAVPAQAVIKISQAAVAYQDHPEGDKRCGKCMQFQSPSSCKLVDGPISPNGFCRLFTPLRQAAATGSVPAIG
jgi:hypothetical protein